MNQLEQDLLQISASTPAVQAAIAPVELMERQAGEFTGSGTSLLRAFETARAISEKHPGASRPFDGEAAASGLRGKARAQAALLLLGAEIRRGLLTYRLAGLTPRASETELVQSLKRYTCIATRLALAELLEQMSAAGRKVSETDLYLAAWGEGLCFAASDPILIDELRYQNDADFILSIMEWGRRHGESRRSGRPLH